MVNNMVKNNEAMRERVRQAIKESLDEIIQEENKKRLSKSFRMMHPEWTEEQLLIAVEGRAPAPTNAGEPKSEVRAGATEVAILSLNQRVALQFEGGREVFVSLPYDGKNTRPPDWEVIKEYARQHPKAKLLLWLNGEIKEL